MDDVKWLATVDGYYLLHIMVILKIHCVQQVEFHNPWKLVSTIQFSKPVNVCFIMVLSTLLNKDYLTSLCSNSTGILAGVYVSDCLWRCLQYVNPGWDFTAPCISHLVFIGCHVFNC